MWAKVKRRCRAMLRFIRSLRNNRGEWRGEFRGEPQGDILGDPQGKQDDWGFSWMAWGLLSGKEPASSELSQGASLILLFIGLIKLLLIYSAVLSVLTGSPVRPLHSSSILSEEKLLSLSCNDTLHTHRHLWELRIFIFQQALSMDTDMSAGVSPPLSSKLCLHSTEFWLNMARPEL